MTAVYGAVLAVGLVALFAWIVTSVVGSSVEGWGWIDLERRAGRTGRAAVAAAVGFGMGGLSAAFAGRPPLAALLAAVAGAGILVLVALTLGPAADTRPEAGRER